MTHHRLRRIAFLIHTYSKKTNDQALIWSIRNLNHLNNFHHQNDSIRRYTISDQMQESYNLCKISILFFFSIILAKNTTH